MSILTDSLTSPPTEARSVYTALPWQIPAFYDTSPVMLCTGAAGGGKSRVCGEKLHAYLMRYPGATGIIGRKDKTAAGKSVVPFMLHSVMGGTTWGTYLSQKGLFEYNNGSNLWVVGVRNEEQRESLRSIGKDGSVDIAWFEEANKLEEIDHNEVEARMRGTKGGFRQVIYSTNPGGPTHWINKRLIQNKEAEVYTSRAIDNPYNPADYIERLKRLTGISRKRLWEGLWVQSEGIVFPEFDEPNIVSTEPDPELPIELAADDGYVDPRCILFIQRTATEILIFDEIYHSTHLAETCVNEAVEMCNSWNWLSHIEDEEEREATRQEIIGSGRRMLPEICIGPSEAKELQERFRLADIVYRKGTHKIITGIDKMRRLIKDSNEYRTLKVHRRCKNFIGEITDGYRYPEAGANRKTENPIDKNNHAMDAFRYWAFKRS